MKHHEVGKPVMARGDGTAARFRPGSGADGAVHSGGFGFLVCFQSARSP